MMGGNRIAKKSVWRFANYITVIIAVAIIFIRSYNDIIEEFQQSAEYKQIAINDAIKPCTSFIESMTIYGNHYMQHNLSEEDDEKLFELIEYNAITDSYNLDAVGGTEYESIIGNVTGSGSIPTSDTDRSEINLSMSYFDYYINYLEKMPDVIWLYYTSENNFISIYPWISSLEFQYSDKIKTLEYYTAATPKNNPSRKTVWSPVYQDEAGKGLMVTLSSPIYDGNDFKGVVSLDLSTMTIRKLLKSDYDSYLIDDSAYVIATGQNIVFDSGVKKINELMEKPELYSVKINQTKSGSVQRIGSTLIYRYSFDMAPWSMIMSVSVYTVVFQAFLHTLPIILIGLMLLIMLGEVDQRRKAEKKIRVIAITDELTGLRNRHYLDTVIQKEFSESERYKKNMSVVLFDLDHFKKVNDTWGHPIGDEVLKHTAEIANQQIRKSDTLVRFGGEEFLAVLPETDILGAYETAEKIRKALETTVHPIAGQCTASFGIAEKKEYETYIELYKRVDEALYQAKQNGRNCTMGNEENYTKPLAQVRIEWNNKWNSGNKIIDAQHREILELSNRLMFMSMSNYSSEKIEAFLEIVFHYISEHFTFEENFQLEIGYPNVTEHAVIHQNIIKKALKIKDSYKTGEIKPSEYFSFILDDIVIGHMQNEDVKFFSYIQKDKHKKA